MSTMTKVALPPQAWTLVHTAGALNVQLSLHGSIEALMYITQGAAPTDLSGPLVPFTINKSNLTLDATDKIYLWNQSADTISAVTVWSR